MDSGSGRTRQLPAVWLVTLIATGLWATTSWSQDAAKPAAKDNAGQPSPKTADSADKELEAAAAKAREGRVDEALGLIKEKAVQAPRVAARAGDPGAGAV